MVGLAYLYYVILSLLQWLSFDRPLPQPLP